MIPKTCPLPSSGATATMSLVTTQPSSHYQPHHDSAEETSSSHTANGTMTTTRKRCQAELRLTNIDTTIMTSSSSSSSSSSCSSLLDFQSLQSSLKRVRLSMSPGELRLERDLRNLVTSEGWNKVEQHVWLFGGDKSSALEQTPGDPLRLVLVTHQVSVFLQIPRRYPHRPPVVSRVIYPATAQRSLTATLNDKSPHSNRRSRIENILVHEAPPFSSITDAIFGFASTTSPSPSPSSAATSASNVTAESTVIYSEWSPVKRLGDLLRFIMDVLEPEQQKQQQQRPNQQQQGYNHDYLDNHSEESLTMSWDASESPHAQQNRSGHQNIAVTPPRADHHRLKLDDEDSHIRGNQETVDQLSASLKSSSMDGGFESTHRNSHALTNTAPSSFFVEEHKSMNEMEYFELDSSSMDEMATTMTTPTKRIIHSPLPFPPNRFDVGYAKASRSTFADTSAVMRATASSSTMQVVIPFSSLDWSETPTVATGDVHHMDL